jgi:hypothetical protein
VQYLTETVNCSSIKIRNNRRVIVLLVVGEDSIPLDPTRQVSCHDHIGSTAREHWTQAKSIDGGITVSNYYKH